MFWLPAVPIQSYVSFFIRISLIVHQQRDINVHDYIQEYTNLARSTIIKILSDLKKNIVLWKRGRLLNLIAPLKRNVNSQPIPF